MPAQPIDGVKLSQQLRAEIAERAKALTERGKQPGLAVILVGEDPASQVYVRNKIKACGDVGIRSLFDKYDASLSEGEGMRSLRSDPLRWDIVGALLVLHFFSCGVCEWRKTQPETVL